jgi:hypothetical protein
MVWGRAQEPSFAAGQRKAEAYVPRPAREYRCLFSVHDCAEALTLSGVATALATEKRHRYSVLSNHLRELRMNPYFPLESLKSQKFKTREKALSLTWVSRGDRTSIELFRKGVEALASTLPFMQQALAWLLGSASSNRSSPE